jgi:NO-binding membrane sensor protein with MHYT domain
MNNHIHHFGMGLWLLFLAYIVSVTGSVVGLACTRHSAAASNERERLRWLAMASIAIGGVGIWLMHFIAMHYTGMWAVRIQGTLAYNKGFVALSILIALVAATAALWFTLVLKSPMLRFVAGLVMGVAVAGMHYTGMAAVRVTVDRAAPIPDGLEAFSFLFPVFVIGVLALAVPITAVMLAPDHAATGRQPESRPSASSARQAR